MKKSKAREAGGRVSFSLARLMLFLVSIVFLNGCDSGSDIDLLNTSTTQAGTAAGNNTRVLLSERFLVALGETRRFRENTAILASEDITVNGQIELDPGVSLTLFSPTQINVSGQIGPAPGVTTRGTFDILGRAIRGQGTPPSFVVLASPGHNLSGTIQGTEDQDIFIASYGENRSVTISGSVTAGPGRVGTRTTAGGPGADVHIGDAEANTAAASSLAGVASLAGDLSSTLPSASDFDIPNQLSVTGSLNGGKGGKGFTDSVGVNGLGDIGDDGADTPLQALGVPREFQGGDGGPGGDLILAAEDYRFDGTVQAGSGGDGGDCGVANGLDRELGPGQSVVCDTGDGGPGGMTTILDTRNAIPIQARSVRRAEGGTPGASRVRAGNGSLGFDGGDTTILPGEPGLRGAVEPANAGLTDLSITLRCQIVLEGGGNGGTGDFERRNGGDGGQVRISVPTSLTADSTTDTSLCTLDVSISNYANAGDGFDGCSATPRTSGGNGGSRGARLVLSRELQFDPSLLINNSFNDGDGGDGDVVPGRGGESMGEIDFPPMTRAEVLALDSTSFQVGGPGVFCPTTEASVDLDLNSPLIELERNFEFDSEDPNPNCGTLAPFAIRAESRAVNYTLTPRPPQGAGGGISLSTASGTLNPFSSVLITPTFVCRDETRSFEHTFDLVITADNGSIRDSFVIVFRGTETDPPPCVTQAVFRNNTVASTVDIRFQDDNMRVGTDVIVRFGQERVFEESVALENLTIQYGSNGSRIGDDVDVPCGSRAVFTLNPDLTTSITVEPIPAP